MAKAKAAAVEEKKIAVVEPETTDLSVGFDYGEDAGAGFENQTAADMSIPFLGVLQALSPQVADGGIAGAKAGMFFNTVSEELYSGKDGVLLCCATTQHKFVEYVPRLQGGGFKGVHELDSDVVTRAKAQPGVVFGKLKTPDGNDLVETFYIYGLLLDADESPISPIVISFSSTKIKAYKALMGKLRTFQIKVGDKKVSPPLFAHIVRLTTFPDKSAKGPFYNIKFAPAFADPAGDPEIPSMVASLLKATSPAIAAAVALRESVNGGTAKVSYAAESREPGEDPGSEHF